MIFSLLLWTVIILALVKLVQLLLKNKSQQINSNKPVNSLELLKERYARGDIDEETYQKIKQELLSRS
ncbi:SHOCT domain-containing protein [Vibrio parahaemolyticus]